MGRNQCKVCRSPLTDGRSRYCKFHRPSHTAYMLEYMRKQSGPSRERRLQRYRDYAKANREEDNARHIQHRRKLKADIVGSYGGKCKCCGETELKFLTVHHPDGGGGRHRRELRAVGGGTHYYRHIKRLGYPRGLLEVWCFNCHMAERTVGGCPHKRRANV